MMLALALSIENNPVSLDIGWVNLFAQAKFTPTIAAAAVLILGILLTVKQLKGTHASAHISKEELKRLAVILPLIAGYLLAVYFSNFTVPHHRLYGGDPVLSEREKEEPLEAGPDLRDLCVCGPYRPAEADRAASALMEVLKCLV